jgi:PD-(D/E)XK nuclease superfamily
MGRVPKVLGWGLLSEVTLSRWIAAHQCALKGLTTALDMDGPLPEQLPTRATLVGKFYHKIMERAVSAQSAAEIEGAIEAEIVSVQAEANTWKHLRKAGSVSGWDEINASASLGMRIAVGQAPSSKESSWRAEQMFKSRNGMLLGKPDYFRIDAGRGALTEYKSGAIRGKDGEIKKDYLEQLLFYGTLLLDHFDVPRIDARLESLSGDFFETSIDQADAASFIARVRASLESLNAQLRAANTLVELAVPSADACRSCVTRPVCTAFKSGQDCLGIDGEQFLVEGHVTAVTPFATGAMTYVTITDRYRKSSLTIAAPADAVADVVVNCNYQLLDLRRHGTSLQWGSMTRVLLCD